MSEADICWLCTHADHGCDWCDQPGCCCWQAALDDPNPIAYTSQRVISAEPLRITL